MLKELQTIQEKNDKARIRSWRQKIHADEIQQRHLIIRNISDRFLQDALKELKEKHEAGGSEVRKNKFTPSIGSYRPSTAPTPNPPKRQSSWLKLIPNRPNSSQDDMRRLNLNDYQKLTTAEKRGCFMDTIASAHKKDPSEVQSVLRSQISIEAGDSKAIFSLMVKYLPYAQRVNFFFDSVGATKQRISAFPDGIHVPPSKLKRSGIALVFDPTIVTRGKKVTLYIKYEDALVQSRPGTTSRSPSPSSPHKVLAPLGNNSTSAPAHERDRGRPRTSDATPRSSRAYSPNASTNGSMGPGSRSGSRRGRRPRKQIVTREYHLRGAGRLDLPLITESNNYDSAGGGLYHPDVDDFYDVYLPGWEDIPPIFIPSNVSICQVVVSDDGAQSRKIPDSSVGFSSLSLSTPVLSGSIPPELSSTPNACSSDTSFSFSEGSIFIVPVCTFPCRSQQHAVSLMSKFMEDSFRPTTANVAVHGSLALQIASFHGNIEAVRQLISSGANVNMKTSKYPQNTALHDAVLGGQIEVVRFLLQNGAKQTVSDATGNSPLHIAAMQGNVPIAKILMASDGAAASLARCNGKNMLPVDLAGTAFIKSILEIGMRANNIMIGTRQKIF